MELINCIIYLFLVYRYLIYFGLYGLVIMVSLINTTVNINNYLKEKDEISNPLFKIIRKSYLYINNVTDKVSYINSNLCKKYYYIEVINQKYTQYNNYFNELINLSKTLMIKQLVDLCNGTINNIANISPTITESKTKKINGLSNMLSTMDTMMNDCLKIVENEKTKRLLNNEKLIDNDNLLDESIEEINKLENDIKLKMNSNVNIYLYDSDEDNTGNNAVSI